jgi:predicted O-methyltransferase YrrM
MRRVRALPPGVRLAHALEPLYTRAPQPFVGLLALRLGLPAREVLRYFRAGTRADFAKHVGGLDPMQNPDASGCIGIVPGTLLYALVRALRPSVIIETGVANGVSSTFLLGAIRDNGHGKLVSIDLPFTIDGDEPAPIMPGTAIEKEQWSPVPRGRDHGWIVPEYLRASWDLRMGDARELLPEALGEHEAVDFFLHDSLHTLDHMLFEFRAAWPKLRSGGLLASDDLGRAGVDPLQRFSREVGQRFYAVGGLGFIRKP